MGLKEDPLRADSPGDSTHLYVASRQGRCKGKTVIKLRRRTVAATTASDLPFCGMCGAAMRVDAASGRCALGHRVTAPGALLPQPLVTADATADVTAVIETPFEETTALPVADVEPAYETEPIGGPVSDGLYEAYQSANASSDRIVTWDDVVAPAAEGFGYDDYAAWDEPTTAFSSLDVDTNELPVAADEDYDDYTPSAAPTTTPIASELLDELDDAAYARRKAVGTIGATIAATGALFASIAVLPI